MDHARWIAAGRMLPFGPHRVFVREAGEGPPIVFLHGFPTSSVDYEGVIDILRATHRCITFDFLGFGESSKPFPYVYGYDEQVALTLTVLRDVKVTRAVFVAHDYAVSVAQELLARDAEGRLDVTLSSLVLLNGGLFGRLHRPLLIQRLLASPLGAWLGKVLITRKTFERSMARVLGKRPLPPGFFDDHWEAIVRHEGARVVPLLLRYIEERRTYGARWERALKTTGVPLAFVWGMDDPVSGRHMLEEITREVPGGVRIAMEGVGHYPQCEAIAEVAVAIRDAASSGRPG